MVDIIQTIQGVPTNIMIFIALTVGLGIFFYVSGNWVKETQLITIGMLAVAGIMAMKETKPRKSLEDAKLIALDWAREKRQLNIIKGNIRESVEGVTRERNGRPWYHECAIVVDNPSPEYYVVSVTLLGEIRKTTKKKSWSAKDAPDVEIVTPPDFMSWYKMSKRADKEMEEAAK